MMKKIHFLTIIFSCCLFYAEAQVGISTSDPEAALDVVSSNSGVLIPRVALNSKTDITTVVKPNETSIAEGTLVYNNGTGGLDLTGFYYWNGTSWLQMINKAKQVYMGKFIINSAGSKNIVGIPFKPKRIEFKAYANIDAYDLASNSGVPNNSNSKDDYFGFMTGYAYQNGATIDQQVIQGGGSADSIDDHSRYSSDTNCIGIRYANDGGNSLGLTTASLTSFNTAGFTLNVNDFTDEIVVIYIAHRY